MQIYPNNNRPGLKSRDRSMERKTREKRQSKKTRKKHRLTEMDVSGASFEEGPGPKGFFQKNKINNSKKSSKGTLQGKLLPRIIIKFRTSSFSQDPPHPRKPKTNSTSILEIRISIIRQQNKAAETTL